MDKLNIKVSIFTSCYNQGEFLTETIESVLNQTYKNFEYFLYDDGSTDETWDIIQKYAEKDNRIIAERLSKQPTLAHIVNRCLSKYKGDIWTWCPSDDIFEPNLLEIKIKYQLLNPGAVLYHDALIINEKSEVTAKSIVTVYTPAEIKKLVWEKSMIWMTGIFIPRLVFDNVGGFPEHIQLSEDFYWMIKATIHDIDFIGVPNILHRKRKSKNQTSYRRMQDIEENVQKMRLELSEYKNNLIPKQVFFFWGNEKMSWMRYMTLKSFRMFNPNWKMILYLSDCNVDKKQWNGIVEQDFFRFNGIDYKTKIDELNIEIRHWDISDNTLIKDKVPKDVSASHKSNFFKWYTLYSEGGIYSDLDIIYFKSIDGLYNELIKNNYNTAICETKYLSIGLLASTKNNSFYKDVFISCYDSYNPNEYQSAGVMSIHKMFGQKRLINEESETINLAKLRYPHLKFYNIPFDLVYPLDSMKIEYAFTNDLKIANLSDKAIGYHWYAGHPIAQKYNELLTNENYFNYNVTYSNIAKEILDKNKPSKSLNVQYIYVFLEVETPIYSSHIFYDEMNSQIKEYLVKKNNIVKTISIQECCGDSFTDNHVFFVYPTTVFKLINKQKNADWLLNQKLIFIIGENVDESINTFIGWDGYKSICNFNAGILFDFIKRSYVVTYQNNKMEKLLNKIRGQDKIMFFSISGWRNNMLPSDLNDKLDQNIDILFYASLSYPRRVHLMLEILKYLNHCKIIFCNNIFDLNNLLKRSKIVLHINSVDNCYHVPYAKIIQPLLYNKIMLVEETQELLSSDLFPYLHTFKYDKSKQSNIIEKIKILLNNYADEQKKIVDMDPCSFIQLNYNFDKNIESIIELL